MANNFVSDLSMMFMKNIMFFSFQLMIMIIFSMFS